MQTSLALFQYKRVGTGADDADCLSWVLDTGHLNDLGSVVLNLLNQIGVTKLVLGKSIDVGHRLASRRPGNEFDFVPLDILDDHDLQLCQEMQREIVDSVSQDGFLDQKNIATGLFNLLAERQQVLTFFLQNLIHLSVIVDNNLVVHLLESSR